MMKKLCLILACVMSIIMTCSCTSASEDENPKSLEELAEVIQDILNDIDDRECVVTLDEKIENSLYIVMHHKSLEYIFYMIDQWDQIGYDTYNSLKKVDQEFNADVLKAAKAFDESAHVTFIWESTRNDKRMFLAFFDDECVYDIAYDFDIFQETRNDFINDNQEPKEGLLKILSNYSSDLSAFSISEPRSTDEYFTDEYCFVVQVESNKKYGTEEFDYLSVAKEICKDKSTKYPFIYFVIINTDYFSYINTFVSVDPGNKTVTIWEGTTTKHLAIRSKADMDEEDVAFVWAIAKELFLHNSVDYNVRLLNEDFQTMKIDNWDDFVTVSGTIHTYNDGLCKYLMQFTFSRDYAKQTGTYKTIYIEIDGTKKYGEYMDILDYTTKYK